MSLAELAPLSRITASTVWCEFLWGEGFRKVGLNDGNFLTFFRGKFGALTFLVLFHRFLALFDHGGHDAAHLRIVEILFHLDFLVQHGGFDHADDVHPQLVSGLHGELQIFG